MLLCPASGQSPSRGPEIVTDPRTAAESKPCIVQRTASQCTYRNAKARCSLRWRGEAVSQPPPVPKAQGHGATGWHEAAGTARPCRGPGASAAAGTSTWRVLAVPGTRRAVLPCNVAVRATRPSARSMPRALQKVFAQTLSRVCAGALQKSLPLGLQNLTCHPRSRALGARSSLCCSLWERKAPGAGG